MHAGAAGVGGQRPALAPANVLAGWRAPLQSRAQKLQGSGAAAGADRSRHRRRLARRRALRDVRRAGAARAAAPACGATNWRRCAGATSTPTASCWQAAATKTAAQHRGAADGADATRPGQPAAHGVSPVVFPSNVTGRVIAELAQRAAAADARSRCRSNSRSTICAAPAAR